MEYSEVQAVKMIEDCVLAEVEDYSHEFDIEDIETEGGFTNAYINFKDQKTWGIHVRVSNVNPDDNEPRYWGKFEVSLYEDNWEECKNWDWTAKYFWMALLS